jgi:ABC-type multidrug transport system fused ATPase/permease subunit
MYQSLVPGIVSTYELLDYQADRRRKTGAIAIGEVHGDRTFDNVSFGYSPVQKVLNNISFDIKEGETVAFVGRLVVASRLS